MADSDSKQRPPRRNWKKAKRKTRYSPVSVRFTDAELELLKQKMDAAGVVERGTYIKMVVLDTPPPKRKRPANDNQKSVAKFLGALGRVGSNLNQIAHALNESLLTGGLTMPEATEIMLAINAVDILLRDIRLYLRGESSSS